MSSGPADTYPRLLGDVGGTNARFALVRSPGAGITDIRSLACADFAGPAEAIRHFLDEAGCGTPRRAAIGIANPITGDWLKVTNNHWAFSIEALRQTLGLDRLHFVNDFTALALALPYLGADEVRQIGAGVAKAGEPIGVIGPGTGLGVSGLLPAGGGWVALGGEGGHVSLSPQTEEEMAVTTYLLAEFGHVSAERILSGPGLGCLYTALASVRGLTQPARNEREITEAALETQDAFCVDTLNMFCALLGSTAGNLALTLGARGGIYIGGGIVPRLGCFFDRSPFRERFEAKGRFRNYLLAIPSLLITARMPALTGAAAVLDNPLNA